MSSEEPLRPFLAAMVLPGYWSRSGRDPLDSSHESGSAVGHGRANRGHFACARNRAHSSQKQRSPGCVLTVRRPGFDTQLFLDRTFPNSPLPSGPTADMAVIPDTRTGQALAYDGAFSPVPAQDCSTFCQASRPGRTYFCGHLSILPTAQGYCNRQTGPPALQLPYTNGPFFGTKPRFFRP